ncbi:MAG TPA: BatA and WFA domain-containing protein [Candidatus Anammoximicrobium sp.]|nr:BatA and WFA domain-containing protein [Candidatus Anammoximicrobium sp.]
MDFINSLNFWQWTVLGLVPAAIVALYFLKLKRQPLEVPSTYLWSRTIEDLHVNSIWQRLRQSLLLFLQLLLIAILMAACLRPGWRGARLTGDRFIFLVDTSASMTATDVEPTRLEAAKEQILGLIEQMQAEDVALVISFSDVARVEQSFTSNRSLLRQKVNQIKPTSRTSDLREALRAAAGLANPGRTSDAENANDVQVAEALPATLYLYTDGGFAAVPDFSLGNLDPKYVPVGTESPHNVGIVAFTAERNLEKPEQWQAFARLENTGDDEVSLDVSLLRDGQLQDAQAVAVAAHSHAGVKFELPDAERATLQAEIDHQDHLALDNRVYAAMDRGRRARVLFVTPGNEALRLALDTDEARQLADVAVVAPAELETKKHLDQAAAGYWDLIIYDRCVPKTMPQANTLLIGRVPPVAGWSQGPKTVRPIVIDTDRVHPLMQYIEMGDVLIVEGTPLKTPTGGSALIDADIGPVYAIAPREGFEDAVLGFEILGPDDKGKIEPKTDWVIRRSFPVFAMNAIRYLGGRARGGEMSTVKPGQPLVLRTESAVDRVAVRRPDGRRAEVLRQAQNQFVFTDTSQLGIYSVFEGRNPQPTRQFAVNLFDSRESDLKPRPKIDLGHEEVSGQGGLEPARKELWRWLLAAGLVVLAFEWYIFNRRVYL